jgi:hypothetical protein
MPELNIPAISDNATVKSNLTAPDRASNPLVEQWLALHSDSTSRNMKDNQADGDARKQDEDSIAGRQSFKISATDKIAGDKTDLDGDIQAIGKQKGVPGDDQTNRDADMKIVGLDREILSKYVGKLSAEQIEAIKQDISAKVRTAQNSNSDIAQESKYIAGDKREIAALSHGSKDQIEATNREQLTMRKQDAQLESGYITDNNRSMKADAKVLALFGDLALNGTK